LADKLGLTGALGTIAEIRDGQFTGELAGPILHGAEKAIAIRKLAESQGIDLATSTAYSDSVHDQPMLSAVGSAVAVNGDRRLRALARRSGWRSLDFRRTRLARKYSLHAAIVGVLSALASLLRRLKR
jgi:phosphoserine phosphatase